jgi:adenylate cyclase
MQWPASLDYGTQRYPAHVARRLKVLNATTWCGVLLALGFALSDLLDRKLWPLAAINITVALLLAVVPLMHRFGELAGALTYGLISYSATFVICSMLGTDSGMQVQYLAIAAGAVLVLGPERIGLITLFGSVGVGLIIALELLAPADTDLLSPSFMLGNFLACIIGTSAILLAIVLYAVRETSRAEALAQREYKRSETLLANILPLPVAERLKISPGIIADGFDDVSILFADMAGFTTRASSMPPMKVIQFLNEAFTRCWIPSRKPSKRATPLSRRVRPGAGGRSKRSCRSRPPELWGSVGGRRSPEPHCVSMRPRHSNPQHGRETVPPPPDRGGRRLPPSSLVPRRALGNAAP